MLCETYDLLQQLFLFFLFHYTLFHFSACIIGVHTSLLTLWPTCRTTSGTSCFHDYWPENEAQDIMFPWLPSPDWNSKWREVRRNKSTQWSHPITTREVSGAGQCMLPCLHISLTMYNFCEWCAPGMGTKMCENSPSLMFLTSTTSVPIPS